MEAPNLTDQPPASPPARDDDSLVVSVSRQIRVELAVADRSMSDLSRTVGYSPATLSRKLAGNAPFGLDDVDQIAAALGMTGQQLVAAALARSAS